MIVKIVNKGQLPKYATGGSAGMDLVSNNNESITIHPFERKLIPTGIYIELPKGYEAQIRPRSGMALKKGLTVLNAPGTIDSDYRGEVGVILINLSPVDFRVIEPGTKVAQMVIAEYEKADFIEVDSLDETIRGNGGYGHTDEKN